MKSIKLDIPAEMLGTPLGASIGANTSSLSATDSVETKFWLAMEPIVANPPEMLSEYQGRDERGKSSFRASPACAILCILAFGVVTC